MLPNNPIRWLFILVGLGSIAAGVSYLMSAQGDEVGQALLILLPFGIAMIVLGFSRPSDPGAIDGIEAREVSDGPMPRRATVFNPVPARRYTSVVGMAGFLCLGLGMALFPGDSPDTDQGAVRGIGIVFALIFAALIFLSLRGIRRGHMTVVLAPEWIAQRNRLRDQRVEWDEIGDVSLQQWRGGRWTVLHRGGANVMVPHQFMAADPALFHALVVHMHQHPRDRALLADPGGPEALERLRLGAA